MKKKGQVSFAVILILGILGFYFLAPNWMDGKNVDFEYTWLESLCSIHPNCEPGICWSIMLDGELSIMPCGTVCHCPPNPIPSCYDYEGKCRETCLLEESGTDGGNLGCPIRMDCCRQFS